LDPLGSSAVCRDFSELQVSKSSSPDALLMPICFDVKYDWNSKRFDFIIGARTIATTALAMVKILLATADGHHKLPVVFVSTALLARHSFQRAVDTAAEKAGLDAAAQSIYEENIVFKDGTALAASCNTAADLVADDIRSIDGIARRKLLSADKRSFTAKLHVAINKIIDTLCAHLTSGENDFTAFKKSFMKVLSLRNDSIIADDVEQIYAGFCLDDSHVAETLQHLRRDYLKLIELDQQVSAKENKRISFLDFDDDKRELGCLRARLLFSNHEKSFYTWMEFLCRGCDLEVSADNFKVALQILEEYCPAKYAIMGENRYQREERLVGMIHAKFANKTWTRYSQDLSDDLKESLCQFSDLIDAHTLVTDPRFVVGVSRSPQPSRKRERVGVGPESPRSPRRRVAFTQKLNDISLQPANRLAPVSIFGCSLPIKGQARRRSLSL
jgi:hypothetical protein